MENEIKLINEKWSCAWMSWPCQSARKVSKSWLCTINTSLQRSPDTLSRTLLYSLSQSYCPILLTHPVRLSYPSLHWNYHCSDLPRASAAKINAQSSLTPSLQHFIHNLSFTFNWTFSWLSSYIPMILLRVILLLPSLQLWGAQSSVVEPLHCSHHFKQGLYANDAES